jgi:hypothetical protein
MLRKLAQEQNKVLGERKCKLYGSLVAFIPGTVRQTQRFTGNWSDGTWCSSINKLFC